MNKAAPWIIIVALVLVLGGLVWYWADRPSEVPTPQAIENPQEEAPAATTDESSGVTVDVATAVSAYTVRLTDDGFSPARIEVPVGATVTFINQGTGGMWIGADEHPSHTGYDGTSRQEHCQQVPSASFDQCGVGGTYAFTFDRAGTFGYHNHVDASQHGTVVVQ